MTTDSEFIPDAEFDELVEFLREEARYWHLSEDHDYELIEEDIAWSFFTYAKSRAIAEDNDAFLQKCLLIESGEQDFPVDELGNVIPMYPNDWAIIAYALDNPTLVPAKVAQLAKMINDWLWDDRVGEFK